jgi:glycosyltransferase involved in cell wall biosynthesis
MNKDRQVLWLFNLSTDERNEILAANLEIIRSLSNSVKSINVISTHVGEYDFPKNVKVTSLGGGNFVGRVRAILKLLRTFLEIYKVRDKSIVFYHMATEAAAILSIPCRIVHIPQGIWYSHSVNSQSFKFSRLFVNYVFSTSPNTVQYHQKKVYFTGHALQIPQYDIDEISSHMNRKNIVSVGRVVRIKNLEKILVALDETKIDLKNKTTIRFIGSKSDHSGYEMELLNLASSRGLHLVIEKSVPHDKVNEVLLGSDIYFSGTPLSIDKALLEAGMMGCFIVSDNEGALQATGMDKIFIELNHGLIPDLASQIKIIGLIPESQKKIFRQQIAETTRKLHDVENTYKTIISLLRSANK